MTNSAFADPLSTVGGLQSEYRRGKNVAEGIFFLATRKRYVDFSYLCIEDKRYLFFVKYNSKQTV
jgi:hypothetical protein